MKERLILIAVLLVSYSQIQAQNTLNNFSVVKKEIIWEKEFKTSLSFEQLKEKVMESGLFKRTEFSVNKVYCDTKNIYPDYWDAGFRYMGIVQEASDYHYKCFVVISYYEDKYEVTVKRIELTSPLNPGTGGGGNISCLERVALDGATGQFSSPFKGNWSVVLDYTFTMKFDFNDAEQ